MGGVSAPLNVKFVYKRGVAGKLFALPVAVALATHGFHSSLFSSNKEHHKKIGSATCHITSQQFLKFTSTMEELSSLPEVVEAMKIHF